jgi:pyrroline-5-carboxylate reductase
MRVLIIGAGKMIDALLTGLRPDEHDYFIFSPSGTSARALAKKHSINYISAPFIDSPDLVLLGHKPQQLKDVAELLRGKFPQSIVASLLAAVDEKNQLEILGVKKLVRIMANLSVGVKQGVTLLSSLSIDSDEMQNLKKWLSPTGLCVEVTENQLDELTLLTGCGPALFYQFALSLSKCFESLPLDETLKLTAQVFIGSSDLIKNYDSKFSKAIQDVCSKGGVTEAIINSWDKGRFFDEIKDGIDAGKIKTQIIKDSILHK